MYASKYPGRENEPQTRGKPSKPKWLDDNGKQFWRDHIVQMIKLGVVTKTDTAIVWAACRLWQDFCDAETPLERQRVFTALSKALSVLGLSPAERTRVAATAPAQTQFKVVGERVRA